jgi:non-haem Fe2+, alpha-ketoglutarate-dependent halogenase
MARHKGAGMDLVAERKHFDEQGFIGPFKLWEPDFMRAWWKEQRRELLDPQNKQFAVFDNPMNYDRHLDISGFSKIISEPEIVRRMQALIGPDVLCWRTEIFSKNSGESGTGWHQVETYAVGETSKGVLEPTEFSEGIPMELTAWVAFTEASKENGCLKMLPGSHHHRYYDESIEMKWDTTRAENTLFGYDYNDLKVDRDWNPDDQTAIHLEMNPGEFVIFTARCVHGSNPNSSRRQRMAMAIRVVPTHVRVYGGMTGFNEFGQHFDLSRHGCVLVAGENKYDFNRVLTKNARGESFITL